MTSSQNENQESYLTLHDSYRSKVNAIYSEHNKFTYMLFSNFIRTVIMTYYFVPRLDRSHYLFLLLLLLHSYMFIEMDIQLFLS